MRICGDIDPLIAPYVDGSVSDRERAEVEAHLAACPACRAHAGAERTVRDVLRARGANVRGQAPPALVARCRQAPASRAASRRRAWIPVSAAAALLLAVGGVLFYGLMGRLDTALAAQLTLDHVKCFSLASTPAEPPPPAEVEELLRARWDWDVQLPRDTRAVDLELVGARRCHYGEGALAHVMYRRGGRPISVFVLEARHAERVFDIMGHHTLLWSKDGRTYALVGDEAPEVMTRLAAFVSPELR